MARARNMVIAGDYEGKIVCRLGNTATLILGLNETLSLASPGIDHIELIDESSDLSVASAATRGFIGEILFGPIGLAAAATAKRNERYILGIVFQNEKRCVIEVDGDLYRLIVSAIGS